MKTVTVKELEERYDEILDDVVDNNVHYLIKGEQNDVGLVPCSSYDFLLDTYQSWVEDVNSGSNFDDWEEQPGPGTGDSKFS